MPCGLLLTIPLGSLNRNICDDDFYSMDQEHDGFQMMIGLQSNTSNFQL